MPNLKAKREARLPPQMVRLVGIELNHGRVHGWTERLAHLLDTPALTIRAWASADPRNYRPIPGSAATLLLVLVKALRAGTDVDAVVSDAEDFLSDVLGQLEDARHSRARPLH